MNAHNAFVRLETIDTLKEFLLLAREWDSLVAQSRQVSPFLAHGWLSAWWAEYSVPSDRMHVIVCRDGPTNSLVGALPAFIEATGRTFSCRRLRNMADSPVGSSGLGCIADRRVEADVVACVSAHIAETRDMWDVVDLRAMDTEQQGAFLSALVEALRGDTILSRTDIAQQCPTMPLPLSWDGLLSALSHDSRRKLRRRRRDVESVGAVCIECASAPHALDSCLRDAIGLFAQSMARKHGRPFAVSARYARFLASISEKFLASGQLRLLFLSVDGHRVAFQYEIRAGDTMYAFQTGFDKGWARYKVGTVLFAYSIQAAISEGCTRFDFGPGLEPYKLQWDADHLRPLTDLRIYGRSPAGVLAAGYDEVSRTTKERGKSLLPRRLSARIARRRSWRRLSHL